MNIHTRIACYLILVGSLLLGGCMDENHPHSTVPVITLDEVRHITRTAATLSGTIVVPQGSHTDRCRFLYGTSPEMGQTGEQVLDSTLNHVSYRLTSLAPGTTYYYCLEAGNEHYAKRSEVHTFSTNPNEKPTLAEISFLGKGPVSIILQCKLVDTGGESVLKRGFGCAKGGGGKEIELEASLDEEENTLRLRIDKLERNTEYTVRAFAETRVGRSYSAAYTFTTSDGLDIVEAGTVQEIIGDDNKGVYDSLSIIGSLNGTDIRFLREMAGMDVNGQPTSGILAKLDLTDARIVAGGVSYDGTHYTQDDEVGQGMFANLEKLSVLKLPSNTTVIGQDAFKNCSALKRLSIPYTTTSLTPSTGCNRLRYIDVMPGNGSYKGMEGIVYNGDGTAMVWFPEGISVDKLRLSPTLTTIRDYALQHCKVRRIDFPASLTYLGKQAFMGSELEIVMLPDALETVSIGAFQSCTHLTTVTLGSGCKFVSDYSFKDCPLRDLYIRATVPPVSSTLAWGGINDLFARCVLHVPEESREIYVNHSFWGQFWQIVGE